MDNFLSSLMNLGVGGALAGAVIYIHWYTITNTLPGIVRDLLKEMGDDRTQSSREHEQILTEIRRLSPPSSR